MKQVLFIFAFAFLSSCASTKEQNVTKTSDNAVVAPAGSEKEDADPVEARPAREEDMIGIVGVIRLKTPGCPVMIEVTKGDLFSTAYPVNLDKQYHKEGLKIKFDFLPSRAPSPESCTADMVISVANVEIIK